MSWRQLYYQTVRQLIIPPGGETNIDIYDLCSLIDLIQKSPVVQGVSYYDAFLTESKRFIKTKKSPNTKTKRESKLTNQAAPVSRSTMAD